MKVATVLDASAVLAFLQGEPRSDIVLKALIIERARNKATPPPATMPS